VRLPPATIPYILRVTIDAGTPASKNGVFKTNFPLDGGPFARDHFAERKCVYMRFSHVIAKKLIRYVFVR
jgi:N-terminal domain from the human glycogen debranching enzyme